MEKKTDLNQTEKFKSSIKKFLNDKNDTGNPRYSNICEKLIDSEIYQLTMGNVVEISEMINTNKIFNPIYFRSLNILINAKFLNHTEIIKLLDHINLINLGLSQEDKERHMETDFFTRKNFGWFITSADPSLTRKNSLVFGDTYRPNEIEETLIKLIK